MEYFMYNGKLQEGSAAIASANNRGLRFGDGLFETIKCNKGQPELGDEHFARLWKGLQVLQFNIPKHFSPDTLEEDIRKLLKKNDHLGVARVRVTVFRGDGGLYDAASHIPNYLVQSWALPEDTGNWNSNGLVLGFYTDVKKSCDILSNLKHNNFLPYVMAALEAKKQKWNDAIVLNTNDRLCDTTIANIFFIKDEIIYTPALREGCIAGVMRKNIIDKLNSKYRLVEGEFDIDDLLAADEVFLSNSIYNIRWVQSIGEKKYGNTLSQKIYAAVFPTNS